MKHRFRHLLRRLELRLRRRPGPQICTIGGVRLPLDLTVVAQRHIFLTNQFEAAVTAALLKTALPNDIFFDVGAHIGWHTVQMGAHRPDLGGIFSFEPVSKSFSILKMAVEVNGLVGRCILKQIAIGAECGQVSIKTFPSCDLMHASVFPLGDENYEEEVVDLKTLDQVVGELVAVPGVIKCDVEGAELDVLRGASALMAGRLGRPPLWFLESNFETSAMAGYFPWDLISFAQQFQYEPFVVDGGRIRELRSARGLRHGETFVLALPNIHDPYLIRLRT
jgi:FkbM family methyltransferase